MRGKNRSMKLSNVNLRQKNIYRHTPSKHKASLLLADWGSDLMNQDFAEWIQGTPDLKGKSNKFWWHDWKKAIKTPFSRLAWATWWISGKSISHQGNFSLQQTETITDKNNQSKAGLWGAAPMDSPQNNSRALNRSGGGKIGEFAEIVS